MASLADESSPKKPKTDGVEVNAAARPRLVIVFSGKRKSGKDFVTDRLVVAINKAAVAAGLLGEAPAAAEAAGGGTGTGSGAGSAVPTLCCEIGRLSAPLKKAYADENGLDFAELLSDGPYKEKYRASMVVWGEEKRSADPGYFANLVVGQATAPVLIISDARRKTDLAFFIDRSAGGAKRWATLTVRVEASVAAREARGFKFSAGVDDAESECGLDGVANWDAVIANDGAAGRAASNDEERAAAAAAYAAGADGGDEGVAAGPPRLTFAATAGVPGGVEAQVLALAAEAIRRLQEASSA